MKEELDDKLVKDFPNLYKDRYASMQVTCMCWGFPGDGWFDLIYKLSEKLEKLILDLPEAERKSCCASQVKEKFGTLRFYMDGATDEMYDLVGKAENESGKICEDCGKPGNICVRGGWWATRCPECAEAQGFKIAKQY